jgi:hypothetical protein
MKTFREIRMSVTTIYGDTFIGEVHAAMEWGVRFHRLEGLDAPMITVGWHELQRLERLEPPVTSAVRADRPRP